MENAESSNIIPLLTVFISGIFGLIVAIVTWKLANHRENRRSPTPPRLSEEVTRGKLFVVCNDDTQTNCIEKHLL